MKPFESELPSDGNSVFVMMVTYNSAALMDQVLETANAWLAAEPHGHFILVENSDDEHVVANAISRLGLDHSERVIAQRSHANVGFAPGMNLAYDLGVAMWGTPEVIVLLNPDVVTTAQTISALTRTLIVNDLGIVAPVLRDQNSGRLDGGVARRKWNRRRLFAAAAGIPKLSHIFGTPARTFSDEQLFSQGPLRDVDQTSGAFMAIRQIVYSRGLDTRLPMYLEDQEICHRATSQGFRVCVATELEAVHIGGASRKTHSAAQYALRTMELAEAPALSFVDNGGGTYASAQLAMGLGGGVRRMIVALCALPAALSPSKRAWVIEQWRLGGWFVAWSRGKRPRLDLTAGEPQRRGPFGAD